MRYVMGKHASEQYIDRVDNTAQFGYFEASLVQKIPDGYDMHEAFPGKNGESAVKKLVRYKDQLIYMVILSNGYITTCYLAAKKGSRLYRALVKLLEMGHKGR